VAALSLGCNQRSKGGRKRTGNRGEYNACASESLHGAAAASGRSTSTDGRSNPRRSTAYGIGPTGPGPAGGTLNGFTFSVMRDRGIPPLRQQKAARMGYGAFSSTPPKDDSGEGVAPGLHQFGEPGRFVSSCIKTRSCNFVLNCVYGEN
jgi:hypothetical protein